MPRWMYETEDGDIFRMCDVCVLQTEDVEGEYHCPGCHQWYLIRHTDGVFDVRRLADREDAP